MSARRTIAVAAALLRIRVKRSTIDPTSFWAAFFIDTTVFFTQAAVFSVIYLNVDSVNGWDAARTIFFVGTFTLVDALYMFLYFFGLCELPRMINTGKLDLYLTKPCDPLIHASFSLINPGSLFLTLPALLLIGWSAASLGLSPSASSVALYAASVVLMLILMFDLMLLLRLPAFFFLRGSGSTAAESVLVEFGFRMPPSAYTERLRFVFSVILPYALIAGFPSRVFFGDAGLIDWAGPVAVTVVFTALARIGWKLGLSRYEGSGSG